MKRTAFLLLAGDDGWRLQRCIPREAQTPEDAPGPGPYTLDETLDTLRAWRQSVGAQTTLEAVIALPSHWCFCAQVQAQGLPARRLKHTLPYRFEPLLPFPIEELVTDLQGEGDHRLVVGTRYDQTEPMLRALEDEGFITAAICPLVLLAAQTARPTPPPRGRQTTTFAEAVHDSRSPSVGASTLTWEHGRLTRWRWAPQLQETEDPAALPSGSLTPESTLDLACATAADLVASGRRPLINLLQGPLAPRQRLQQIHKPLVACLIAAGVLLLAATAVMQTRVSQYRQATARYDTQARALYAQTFPDEVIPSGIEYRLRNRLRQLEGQQGLAATDTPLYAEIHTLTLLHDLLTRLPSNKRIVVTDLRINTNRIDLLGQARSHSDADALAAALRLDQHFKVTPPSTENLPNQGVRFTLALTPQNPSQPETPPNTLATEQARQVFSRSNTTAHPGNILGGVP